MKFRTPVSKNSPKADSLRYSDTRIQPQLIFIPSSLQRRLQSLTSAYLHATLVVNLLVNTVQTYYTNILKWSFATQTVATPIQ